jgi:4-hydroxy-3-methylbut-2-en-1-yl diphosphate synthase IspG/GcpE
MSGAAISSVGLGILLHEGIGDTMRILACPTCVRNRIDLFTIAEEVGRPALPICACPSTSPR